MLSDVEVHGCLLQLPWPKALLPMDMGSLPMLGDMAATSHVQVQPVAKLKYPSGTHTVNSSSTCVSGRVCFLSWSPCLLCQVCVSMYFVSGLLSFSHSFSTDKVPDQATLLEQTFTHSCVPSSVSVTDLVWFSSLSPL